MASPISPIECLEIAKFAYDLCQTCKAAKDEWTKVGKEVNATHSVIKLVHICLDDPTSIINKLDDKRKTTNKQLAVHIRNCEQALNDVNEELKKYNRMTGLQRLKWAMHGEDVCNDLMADLSSFQTRLDSYVNTMNMKGIAAMYKNQSSMRVGIGRIEQLLEGNGGNPQAAVREAMKDVRLTCSSPQSSEKYFKVLNDYAQEAKDAEESSEAPSPPRPDRGRRASSSALLAPNSHKRAKSADDTWKGRASPEIKRSNSAKSVPKGKRTYVMECWLIQRKSGQAFFMTWQLSEKELQPRGQWKLEQMAKQFKASKRAKLHNTHELVEWVIKDRQKHEDNPKYIWESYAAKMETKGDLTLSLGVEEQAMVIIKRDLTKEEKTKVAAKERKDREVKEEARRKKAKAKANEERAKKLAVKQIEKKWQQQQKTKDKENKAETERRKSEIDELRHEIERLKVAQKQQGGGKIEKSANEKKSKSKGKSPKPQSDEGHRHSVPEIRTENVDDDIGQPE